MQMIYDNFSEFAKQHQELAERFLELNERGYFKYNEEEELPINWEKRMIYYYEDHQEYAEYRRNDCTCIELCRIFTGPFEAAGGEVIEMSLIC